LNVNSNHSICKIAGDEVVIVILKLLSLNLSLKYDDRQKLVDRVKNIMKCPRTGEKLKPVTISGVEIDLSLGCGGVWFDKFELEKFDEVHEDAGEILVEHIQNFSMPLLDPSIRLKCPKDPDVVMMRRYYSPKHQIEIDECPQCGGIWLDTEELSGIRDLFPTQNDLKKEGEKFIDNIMESKEVKAFEKESKELSTKLNNIKNILWSIIR
jgi:Zn-finger nucleic acid-binding protein